MHFTTITAISVATLAFASQAVSAQPMVSLRDVGDSGQGSVKISKRLLGDVLGTVTERADDVVSGVGETAEGVTENIGGFLENTGDKLGDNLDDIVDIVEGVLAKLKDIVSGLGN